jgi:hypothetical protein
MDKKTDSEIKNIYSQLKTGKSIINMNIDEFRYLDKPIGRALYIGGVEEIKHKPLGRLPIDSDIKPRKVGRPRNDPNRLAHSDDIVICDVCGNKFVRKHRTKHKRTKKHLIYERMNKKFMKLFIEDTQDLFPSKNI